MRSSPVALLPLGLFLAMFVGSGLYYQNQGVEFAFYQISAPVAIIPAIALAVLLAEGSLTRRLDDFVQGMGHSTIITMVLVYLLAGAFASVTKAIGGVDAAVALGLSVVPEWAVLPGLFIVSAGIATAMGTSMGTIAAVAPIALGVAEAAGLDLPIVMGAVIGGAMFGDNLSIISDTTIAATRTQGCEMRDKFKLNFKLALPAALITVALLVAVGGAESVEVPELTNGFLALPYLLVFGLALAGVNVLVVLFIGILAAGLTGFLLVPDYSFSVLSKDAYAGFTNMQEIMILSMFIGGLGALVQARGGLEYICELVERLVPARRRPAAAGELGIASVVGLTNLATANNTVTIVLTGHVAKNLAQRYGVDSRRSASLMDIFACVVQGFIPYGAQVLLAASIAKLSPLALVGSIYYCAALAVVAVISIAIGRPKH